MYSILNTDIYIHISIVVSSIVYLKKQEECRRLRAMSGDLPWYVVVNVNGRWWWLSLLCYCWGLIGDATDDCYWVVDVGEFGSLLW
jgi:hypothetical protein